MAVMLWLPMDRLEVLHVATPAASAWAPQPVIELAPSLKFPVPVGVPAPAAAAVTVAVKLADCPITDGLAVDVSVLVVLVLLTTCVTVELVLVVKFVSPPYTAVMLCVPTLRADVAHVATPAASAWAPQ